jgi:anthranilate synthase/aminodeoxychorismate synthase-like glutamine amidotransferase
MSRPRVVILDCLDSFTANLAHALIEAGAETSVVRRADEVEELRPTHLVLSPGPGSPRDAEEAMRAFAASRGRRSVLGVCLGHQVIAGAHGLAVERARRPRHGHTSPLRHVDRGLFRGLPQRFPVARYHSLIVNAPSPESPLTVDAVTDDDERCVMALRHRVEPVFGVQFHPESFLSVHGRTLLRSFLAS